MTSKELDKMSIINYLQGKDVALVADIMTQSGAEPLRIFPILFEMEQAGELIVTKRGVMGDAIEVKLSK